MLGEPCGALDHRPPANWALRSSRACSRASHGGAASSGSAGASAVRGAAATAEAAVRPPATATASARDVRPARPGPSARSVFGRSGAGGTSALGGYGTSAGARPRARGARSELDSEGGVFGTCTRLLAAVPTTLGGVLGGAADAGAGACSSSSSVT